MENSEDDAGTATTASRRESAREKDVGQAEDVDATGSYNQEPTETRTSCQTPAMSEDNFDGDSVPSPSAQDVNTSTEAILDMIDEIVDGPGAPKRLPLALESIHAKHDEPRSSNILLSSEPCIVTNVEQATSCHDSVCEEVSRTEVNDSLPQLETAAPITASITNDTMDVNMTEKQTESASVSCAFVEEKNLVSDISPQASSSLTESQEIPVCVLPQPALAIACLVPETSSTSLSNIPLSATLDTEQTGSDISDCEKPERTVKCVSSSDNRDSVTVESAESTSSDCSVSEGKAPVVEPNTRTPVRRRLVRPVPNDRRPDSTVSSTVDSQTVNIFTTLQKSDNITKDVSSSSDAMPVVHGNVKPEEIREVSEISICQAETSMIPPKKIKLIRQKITPVACPVVNNRDNKLDNQESSLQREQCQSTSSDTHAVSLTDSNADSSSSIGTFKQHIEVKSEKVIECASQEVAIKVTDQMTDSYEEKPTETQMQSSCSVETTSCVDNTSLAPEGSSIVIIPMATNMCDLTSQELPHESNFNNIELNKSDGSNTSILPDIERITSPLKINESISSEPDVPIESSNAHVSGVHEDKKDDNTSSSNLTSSKSLDTELKSDANSSNTDLECEKKVPPIKLNLLSLSEPSIAEIELNIGHQSTSKSNVKQTESETVKQVPKLTIKLGKQVDENKSPIPKLTIKPIRPPTDNEKSDKINDQQIPSVTKINIKPIPKPPLHVNEIPSSTHAGENDRADVKEQISCVTRLNIKPILKPPEKVNDSPRQIHTEAEEIDKFNADEPNQIPSVTKLNIKPIRKHPEKINDIHRKSSSSEISESECSENDESTSTSDQASASDQGSSNVVPKVTIKLGKPGTECEGKFYTEKNIPKLTIKGIHPTESEEPESLSKLKLVINQSDDKPLDKIPKLTIKTVTKSESQPLSPKLTIKPLKPPESICKENEIPKIKISTDTYSGISEIKESVHVPRITIKPITKTDIETPTKTPKKAAVVCDSPDHIPVITKLNIKPIIKPTESGETSDPLEEKVPVVSKLNIKPIVKPKENEVDSSVEDLPKITKLNIKPLKIPEVNSSEQKDCDGSVADIDKNSIPIVTKLNIKPVVKPIDEEIIKDTENQSSETGNSSDDNADHIPFITKLNIKPVLKPTDSVESPRSSFSNEQIIPVITKLNIKPLVKPDDISSPGSPKKEHVKSPDFKNTVIPVVTKLNIKPIVKPENNDLEKFKDENEVKLVKNPPILMKINIKSVVDTSNSDNLPNNEHMCNNISEHLNVIKKTFPDIEHFDKDNTQGISYDNNESLNMVELKAGDVNEHTLEHQKPVSKTSESYVNQNCVPDEAEEFNSEKSVTLSKKQNASTVLPIHAINKDDRLLPPISSPTWEHNTQANNSLTIDPIYNIKADKMEVVQTCEENKTSSPEISQANATLNDTPTGSFATPGKHKVSLQNCTLLKKLLEKSTDREQSEKKEDSIINISNCHLSPKNSDGSVLLSKSVNCSESLLPLVQSQESGDCSVKKIHIVPAHKSDRAKSPSPEKINDNNFFSIESCPTQALTEVANDSLTKQLEINISEKVTNQSSGQDSPRIILKINKTDHGPSAKIITEDIRRSDTLTQNYTENENTHEDLSNRQSPKKHNIVTSRRKQDADDAVSLSVGKRLRSSRIVESTDKSPIVRRGLGKRPSATDTSPTQNKEPELSVLETKRLKLGQLLSGNKSLTITPVVSRAPPVVSKVTQTSPTKPSLQIKQGGRSVNHTILNNENCSKNGNSRLHNILSNLQAKQMQSLSMKDAKNSEKHQSIAPDVASNASSGSLEIEIVPTENCHSQVQELIINESSEFRELNTQLDEISQDPLEVECVKSISEENINSDPPRSDPPRSDPPRPEELTPQPKKRGRPRKLPASEGAKPVTLPVPALEERPQRSLRLTRERPTILAKPRGRGRGRGGRRLEVAPTPDPEPVTIVIERIEDRAADAIDMTSSRIKLPRMTEALDNMPGGCSTPLSSRRRSSAGACREGEPKVVLEATLPDLAGAFAKAPDTPSRGRGGRGGRGARGGRTPRGRGRGRGGGRGVVYMKETMGIYGCVCGPATTTVQLFEEETCMMDDNATPAKPSHLLDEDSQSSVKSSTNESSKTKKSKFADLFDSNKVWTAADVKEYKWPQEKSDEVPQVMMIQEQVAMFLGVKGFKRRYPELKRRPVVGDEKDYLLAKGLVTEALCDLGITAVDASEVLDIMLSDYPHKYEEYRSHQRERQLAEPEEPPVELKTEDKAVKVEVKMEKSADHKPDVPKIDPEKTRQDMAAAAIASAAEWNARANALRRPACADLQSMTVHRRRAPPPPPPPLAAAPPPAPRVRPPAGFYPHALLPGQYQHWYRTYTPEQLRYFPLSTVTAAPRAPASPPDSSSDSEAEWRERASSSDASDERAHPAKRKKLSKTKRSSQAESKEREEAGGEGGEDTCRTCKLRLEGNRRHTHERFLVCANCNAKLHPTCVELSADTIRKCREYAWQCAECKTCGACGAPADDDKMLFCDLCDRGFHIYCVGLDAVPNGRWHCVECAICKSCGARDPAGIPASTSGTPGLSAPGPSTPGPSTGPAEWHHQTRRGPGGHKVYSHSLCTPCARAYRIGRYCPLCDRSFIGPKGTMQLVICKLCDRQLHQECVRQTVSALNVLDYTCAECRRGGITSRAAAVRLAPRTIATLFMAKRRFNKYAHRQYMRSRMVEAEAEAGAEVEAEAGAGAGADRRRPDHHDASDASESGDPLDPLDPLEGAGDG